MINGLRIEMKTEDLVEHLGKRIEFHLKEAEEGKTLIEEEMGDHDGLARMFKLFADRVIPNETYRLDVADLELIEMI